MIYYSSLDADFPYKQCEELYKINQEFIEYNNKKIDFNKLIELLQGNFWAVCDNYNNLIGCIYFEVKHNDWYLSGFSKRKLINYVKEAILFLIKEYNLQEVYSDTKHKHAVYALLRTGFKKIGYNIYKWRANNGI